MKANSDQVDTSVQVVFLDRDSLPKHIKLRSLQPKNNWVNYPNTSPSDVIARSENANVLIVNKVAIDEETLSACPKLQHIVVSATGYNIVDTQACQKYGVSVSNVPSYASTTVAEHTMMLALILRRKLLRYRDQVIAGQWQISERFCLFDEPINELYNCTLGIIGFGELGRATAALAQAFGMKVIFSSRSTHNSEFAEQVSFEELICTADIISVHCSLNAETSNLISDREFVKMQPHAILLNTARGGIVNEQAAVSALKAEKIAGLGFDVLLEEPPQSDSVLLSIANYDNVVITPHIAWASEQAIQHLADVVVDNIEAFLAGNPKNLVT